MALATLKQAQVVDELQALESHHARFGLGEAGIERKKELAAQLTRIVTDDKINARVALDGLAKVEEAYLAARIEYEDALENLVTVARSAAPLRLQYENYWGKARSAGAEVPVRVAPYPGDKNPALAAIAARV